MSEAWKSWEGQVVDSFPLREYLGGSDHSAVYLTQLNNSGEQKAAIKFVPADEGADEQLARWRAAGQLTHPNLLQLIRVGRCRLSEKGFLYVVMEHADENLGQILPERALEPGEARQMLEAVLAALTYLHAQGQAHTRLKPGNILASGDQLKLSSDAMCEIGGTLPAGRVYTVHEAPELAGGTAVSTAADVWSLGVTLVEALTQRTPVSANQTRAELQLMETLPAPFAEIARRGVVPDPARRASLMEIGELLHPSTATAVSPSVVTAREVPAAVVPTAAETVIATEPPKKSLSSQQVAYSPHTLMPATPARSVQPTKGKSHAGIFVVAAVLILAGLLFAPRMLNRFSQLQPHADSVQPTVEPAPAALQPPTREKNSTTATQDAPKREAAGESRQSVATQTAHSDIFGKDTAAATGEEPRKAAAKRDALAARADAASKPARAPISSNNGESSRPAARLSNAVSTNPAKGAVNYQVVPDVSQRARDTIQGTVRVNVKLRVDANGNVAAADLENNSSRFFADQVMKVTRRWTFTPPQVDGRSVPSEWQLRFEFTNKATKVFPTQTNP
ncbi:MAG TPA: TonB family protein [Candidatus Acidoferrum sp.]|jgi:TonB family protein